MAFFVYGSYSAAQGFGLVKGLLAYQHELSNQGTISINFKMEGEVSINGVKIVAKILNIPEPQISFFDPKEGSNT